MQAQEWATGYQISPRAIEKWFNNIMRIEVQEFLGGYRRGGEGEGGQNDSNASMENSFVSLKGKVEAHANKLTKDNQQNEKDQARNEIIRKGIAENGRLGARSRV